MKHILFFAFVAGIVNCSAGREVFVEGLDVGPVRVSCPQESGWSVSAEGERISQGVAQLKIALKNATNAIPPAFSVSFDVPQVDAHHKWTPLLEKVTMPPNWNCRVDSRLCSMMPMAAFINDNDRNRILAAASEAKRKVGVSAGLREEDCRIEWKFDFFAEPEAPMRDYSVKLRIDTRDEYFGTVIEDGVAWIERMAKISPAHSPQAAFEPLYSSWYSFHQNVFDKEIEAECAEAAKLGMKVLIVDDGWQTDDTNRGYAFCGDWEISRRRFPKMAEHVRRVHDLGMKYMVWFGVPMVGVKANNFPRFKDKLLWVEYGKWADYGCLDPRFPEVRAHLCDLYEKAVREWGIDGLKLDFIDAIGFRGADPAIKDDYAGRDIRSLSEAIDRLLKEVYARLTAIKPDFLCEFRQGYIGPGIRQYGNMLRAGDCPGDLLANRCRTANLRLTSGTTAVHSDMLEWNVEESVEDAARFVLSVIFSTIQYSVMLRTLPDDHRRMVRHWLDFSQKHRETLLHGRFRPHHFEAMYPWIEAESAAERIIAVYNGATIADCGKPDRVVYVLNATSRPSLVLRTTAVPTVVEEFDTFGRPVDPPQVVAGVQEIRVPKSGYLRLETCGQ